MLYSLLTLAQTDQNHKVTSSTVLNWLESYPFCFFQHNCGFALVHQWDGNRMVAKVVLNTDSKGTLAFFWVYLLPRRQCSV